MKGFWHPVSAVYLNEPRVLASPTMLRLVLAGEGKAELVYAGDRMWPTFRHGQVLVVTQVDGTAPLAGDVILANDGGILDVVRLEAAGHAPAVTADADPAPPRGIAPAGLFGRIQRAPRSRVRSRSLARLILDLREATGRGPDPSDDRAQGVRDKYDEQAVHYDRLAAAAIEPRLAASIQGRVPRASRILVAGSGAGREAFELEEMGYEVHGLDFAPRMVAAARAEAARRSSSATFAVADLRTFEPEPRSLGAVVFTYDVYSFVPEARDRTALLTRLRHGLVPGGVVFLSARRTATRWDVALLSLQWLARIARLRPGAWGDSHARRLDASGNLRRSFVHVFTDRGLDREAAAAGLHRVSWDGGHGQYVPRDAAERRSA